MPKTISWVMYGDTNQDGQIKLSERAEVDASGLVRTTVDFFPAPKEEKSAGDGKQAEGKSEPEKKEPAKGEEKEKEVKTKDDKESGMDVSSDPTPAGNPVEAPTPGGAPAGDPAGAPPTGTPAAPEQQQPAAPGGVEPSAPRESDGTQDKRAVTEEELDNPS